MPASHQLGLLPMLGLWAALCLGGGLYGIWLGYGNGSFVATLVAFAFFLAVMLLFAAEGVADSFRSRFGSRGGLFLGAAVFFVYLVYAIGTNTLGFVRAGAIAGLVLVPLVLAVSAQGKPTGAWQDFFTLVGVWIFVKFSPSHWLWPYPGGRLGYVFTVMIALSAALASYLLIRRMEGIGYSISWGRRWGFYVLASFIVFGCIAISLGEWIRFIVYAPPRWTDSKSLPFVFVAILLFTAWPEEFLFRGLLQNMLGRVAKSDSAGWLIASLLFGFSHITNRVFPNWRYVVLATIAGLFYGWTWRKSGSIFASALVHAAVDTTWRFFFRTI